MQYTYDISKDKVISELKPLAQKKVQKRNIKQVIKDKNLENDRKLKWKVYRNCLKLISKKCKLFDLAMEKVEKLNIINDAIMN
ncbi:hypothetical protein [Spiroplasma endosymbiont of Labia minor]|uniref:hypothetical protein n=1 Tax=Spiroplasma endosymbiont of Labia minor TaxID=3066305 RepID=UPI0030D60522